MLLSRSICWALILLAGGDLASSSSDSEAVVVQHVSTHRTADRRTKNKIIKSFTTRSLDLTHEHPHKMCKRAMDQDELQEELISYPFSFSNLISPYTGLGQLIVNPSPYIDHSAPSMMSKLAPEDESNDQVDRQDLVSFGSSLTASTSPASSRPLTGPITSAYYPDWSLDVLKPQQILYSKYDIIFFAFGIPNQDYGVDFTQTDSLDTLDDLVRYAHGNATKVVLSIGGWGGSKFFSSAVRSETTRQIFSNNVVQLVLSHNLDGIDIDWEYPGQAQVQDNIVSNKDSACLLAFFQLLRLKLGPQKILSAAVTDYTFLNAKGDRMSNVDDFGDVLDYILIMNYDVWGASSNPGPNAPFSNSCQDSSQPDANMVSAIKTWTSAGFPRQKILMGLAAYGYINHASTTKLIHRKRAESYGIISRFDKYLIGSKRRIEKRQIPCSNSSATCTSSSDSNLTTSAGPNQAIFFGTNQTTSNLTNPSTSPVNPQQANPPSPSEPTQNATLSPTNQTSTILRLTAGGVGTGNLDSYSGGDQITFTNLFDWGVLQRNLTDPEGRLIGINGYQLAWDSCSSTPYAYSKSRNIVITYDDATSTGIKASYALAAGIGGVGFWDLTGDRQSILIDSARKNLGLSV